MNGVQISMTNLLLTLLVGLSFGFILYKIKVPGGMMVGAIIGVAVLNILFDIAYMPSYAKYAAQITAGAFIGCSVEKSDILQLKYLIKPALLLLSIMLLLNITLGFLIYFISPLDLVTSLMSCTPGGMNDIPIISADMGADAPKVAVMQFVRMAAGIGLFPSLISIFANRQDKKMKTIVLNTSTATIEQTKSQEYNTTVFIQTLAIASVCGILGKLLKIPAGILVFSMIGVICFKLRFNKVCMPMWAKRIAQVLSGAYIGCSINYSDVKELKFLIIPALLLLLGYFTACILVGKLLSKYFNMSTKEAMLAATPAGASDMALISSDLGVHSADLNVLQIIRLIAVVSVFPQIINIIVKLVS